MSRIGFGEYLIISLEIISRPSSENASFNFGDSLSGYDVV